MGAGASAEAASFDDITKWSREKVAEEVAGLGKAFEEYKAMVITNDIDGKALASLTNEDLEGAGIQCQHCHMQGHFVGDCPELAKQLSIWDWKEYCNPKIYVYELY